MNAQAVGLETPDRGGTVIAILTRVPRWKHALPGIGLGRLTTGVSGGGIRRPRRPFPFDLGRQATSGPPRIGLGIGQGDMNHRKEVPPVEVAAGSFGMAPGCTANEGPPGPGIAGIEPRTVEPEDRRTRLQRCRRHAGILGRIDRPLGDRDIAGLCNKTGEPSIGHLGRIDTEGRDRLMARRPLIGIDVVAHQEASGRHIDQLSRLIRRRGRRADQRSDPGSRTATAQSRHDEGGQYDNPARPTGHSRRAPETISAWSAGDRGT